MFYICAICMVKQSPLATFTATRRDLVERIVAPIIDTTPLKDTILLLCTDCSLLIQAMEAFQNTVLIGLKHLLHLHKMVHEDSSHSSDKPNPGSSLLAIKMESKDDTMPEGELDQHNTVAVPIKSEPEDSLVKLKEPDTGQLQPLPQPALPRETPVSKQLLRAHQLELTSEFEVKFEPESESEGEPEEELEEESDGEPEYDSECTLTCDEDDYDDDDKTLSLWPSPLQDHDYSESRVAVFTLKPPAGGARRPPGGAAPVPSAGHYICHICMQRLPSDPALRTHIKRHLARYTSRSCGHAGSNLKDVKQHRCTTDTRKPVSDGLRADQCAVCHATYADWIKFWTHYTSAHLPDNAAPPERHECYVCRRTYLRRITLYAHVKQHFETSKVLKKGPTVRRRRLKNEAKNAGAVRGRRQKAKRRIVKKRRGGGKQRSKEFIKKGVPETKPHTAKQRIVKK